MIFLILDIHYQILYYEIFENTHDLNYNIILQRFDNHRLLVDAIKHDNLHIVKCLLQCGIDIHYDNEYALKLASITGHLHIVEFLVRNYLN